jgi:hypothetical protein
MIMICVNGIIIIIIIIHCALSVIGVVAVELAH